MSNPRRIGVDGSPEIFEESQSEKDFVVRELPEDPYDPKVILPSIFDPNNNIPKISTGIFQPGTSLNYSEEFKELNLEHKNTTAFTSGTNPEPEIDLRLLVSKPRRPHRSTSFTVAQQEVLEGEFIRRSDWPYLNPQEESHIANEISLTQEQVRKWFSNKRHRHGKSKGP